MVPFNAFIKRRCIELATSIELVWQLYHVFINWPESTEAPRPGYGTCDLSPQSRRCQSQRRYWGAGFETYALALDQTQAVRLQQQQPHSQRIFWLCGLLAAWFIICGRPVSISLLKYLFRRSHGCIMLIVNFRPMQYGQGRYWFSVFVSLATNYSSTPSLPLHD